MKRQLKTIFHILKDTQCSDHNNNNGRFPKWWDIMLCTFVFTKLKILSLRHYLLSIQIAILFNDQRRHTTKLHLSVHEWPQTIIKIGKFFFLYTRECLLILVYRICTNLNKKLAIENSSNNDSNLPHSNYIYTDYDYPLGENGSFKSYVYK